MTGEVPSFVGGQPPRGRLRVGTLNTQTVAGRLASVLELGNVHHLTSYASRRLGFLCMRGLRSRQVLSRRVGGH